MPPSMFSIDALHEGSVIVLRLHGELDLTTVPTLEQAVEEHRHPAQSMVIDLSDLEFIDSSGLGIIAELNREQGKSVAFVAPDARVGRMLDITGLRSLLRWVEDARDVPGDSIA